MKSDKKLEDKCFFHEESRRHRQIECDRNIPKQVTYNFQQIGCYDCSGYNFKCKAYLSEKEASGNDNPNLLGDHTLMTLRKNMHQVPYRKWIQSDSKSFNKLMLVTNSQTYYFISKYLNKQEVKKDGKF